MKAYSEKLKKISIAKSESILHALKRMDEMDVKLLVVMEEEKFHGLISIGDIQRAIIRNVSIETPLHEILRKNITVAHVTDSFEEIKKKMLALRTECMPVLDENANLVEVHFWDELFTESFVKNDKMLDIPVVIMAGGLGTRLKPLTNIIPKPLVPVGDKPIVEVIIDGFNKIGVKKFYLTVNYKHEMIKFYFDNLAHKPYSIEFIKEEKPLGTVGSVHLLREKLNSTFFISNCDILIRQDYRDIYDYHVQQGNVITLVGSLKHYKIPYGTMEMGEGGALISMREKPELTFVINSGMYLLEPEVLEDIPENEFYHITDLIDKIKKKGGKVGVFPVSEKAWFDIGEWNEYQQTLKSFERLQ
jgi:dTDP-glucose pyrophosphorylase